ncbi:MAG: phospho-sugar mutase [Acutalibacteraceae bacterium]|nr:phospho-sugar mutase [Acutalibacteraceae bacterium]
MITQKYNLWLEKATLDPDIKNELVSIRDDMDAISDRFYKDLEFGTGGLRGEIGAGTNRMNVYTVSKATQGLSEYVNSVSKNGKVAIAYDSRIKSDVFARTAASIFAANGITVYIYKELMPTPMLSYAVRYFGCDAGVVITASHNPAKYNGYKAYGSDGCQLNLEASKYVLSIMNKVDIFDGIKSMDFHTAVNEGKIIYIENDVIESYLDEVQKCSVAKDIDLSGLNVIYTPLHGSGNKPVRAILDRIGIKNVSIVSEQELPDGNFPTAPYPNPEIKQPFELALKLAETVKPDLLLATDPDCDRVGIAVRHNGEYKLFSGNDVGALLLSYIIERRTATGTMPSNPIAVKTIVTTELCKKIADAHNIELIDVLTGFKFIGEQIGLLEKNGEESRYIFGFEESYGYLAGSYVRDKDAVVASMLICEMVAYYKQKNQNLVDVLDSIYKEYGYFYCSQKNYTFEGAAGMMHISEIMDNLRKCPPTEILGEKTVKICDYDNSVQTNCLTGVTSKIELPSSNVLSFETADGCSLIARPSGTEPKIKFYLSAVAKTDETCSEKLKALENYTKELI